MKAGVRSLRPNDLFALRYVHDARFSPDGRRVAYVVSRTVEETAQEVFEIQIEDLSSRSRVALGFAGRAMYPRWSPDARHLAFVGSEQGVQRLFIAEADGSGSVALTSGDESVQGAPSWSPDGASIAWAAVARRASSGLRRITRRVFRSGGLGLIEHLVSGIRLVDLRNRSTRPLDLRMSVAVQPQFSPCGKKLLFLGTDSAVGYSMLGGLKLFIADPSGATVTEILGERWFIASAAWSPCGEKIIFAGEYDSSVTVPVTGLWIVGADGSGARCLTDGFIGNVGSRLHHDMPTWETSQNNIFCVADRDVAYATVVTHGCTEIWRVSLDEPNRCEPVAAGERSCVIMDACAKTRRILYAASDLRTPWDLHLLDVRAAKQTQLTHLNQNVLAQWPAVRIEHLQFSSDDGTQLEGWFMARADVEGPQPTVMFIHGGPFLSTGHAFRFDFHLLASNGYAVLFANFRGSAGYGKPFARAIVGDWGARGFPDHMAAVDAAVERGLSDAERIGVWGASHGGFATAWIVGHTHRFRAAVAEAAATNFSTLYYLTDAPDLFARDLGGRPDQIPDVYRSRSPLAYAWRCRTPTLLLHGEADVRCPLAEAEQFYRALHDAGCKTELVCIPGMTHMGDSTGPLAARRGQNEALLDWFERHL